METAVKEILKYLGEDINREGLLDTPKRVTKAWEFLCSGYKENPEEILKKALFTSDNKEMVIIKDIELYSTCEHHLLPIIGKAYVAYIPDGKVIGLSKIPRVVDVFARRLQIQEQLTEQIAEIIDNAIHPKGVAVVINARHMCMEMRGVQKICSTTITSSFKGIFKESNATKENFMNIISSSL